MGLMRAREQQPTQRPRALRAARAVRAVRAARCAQPAGPGLAVCAARLACWAMAWLRAGPRPAGLVRCLFVRCASD